MKRCAPFAVSAVLAVVLASGVSDPVAFGSAAAIGSAAQMPPCEDAPPNVPTTPAPEAPTNLRVVGSGGDLSPEYEETGESGPFVPEEAGSGSSAAAADAHGYYMSLASRSDCLRAWSLRNQAQLNSLVAN